MMKFNNILKEEKEGKTITLTNMDRKMLNLLQKQKVDPKSIDNIILFLNDVLSIGDEELILRFAKLYHFNWKPGMFECDGIREDECIEDFSEMKKGIISVGDENYSPLIIALSKNLEVDPFFIENEWSGSITRENTWLPDFNVIHPTLRYHSGKPYVENSTYVVAAGSEQAYDAAYSRVKEDWEENGTEWFSENFIEPYTEVNYDWIEGEAERRAHDDSSDVADEEDMREGLGVTSEYNSYKDDMEFVKKDIVKILIQIQEAEFKRDEIEKERILLEKEIETLGGDIEYDEDNPNHTQFSNEIERLQIKLNQMDGWAEETNTIIELLYQDHSNLQLDIKDIKETLATYEGEKLLGDFEEYRQQYWQDEIENDPLAYLSNFLDITLGVAIDDGYITVDEDALIEGAIDADGIPHFLARHDGDEGKQKVGGVEYYIYRTD